MDNANEENSVTSIAIEAIGDFASRPIQGIEYRRLATPNLTLPSPPRFIFGPCPARLSGHYYRLFGLSSVGIFSARDVNLRGDFLLSHDDIYLRSPELNIHEPHILRELTRLSGSGKPATSKRLSGQYVVLAGPGNRVYGHWLIEYLPKIGLLNAAGFDIHRLKYLLPTSAAKYVHEWLHLLGIEPDQLIQYDPDCDIVCADEILLPTIMHNGARASPLLRDAVQFLRGLVGFKHDLEGSPHGSRIYLSRGHDSSRLLTNREEIEGLAAAAKFTILRPESLSLVDQIRLFSSATQIMGEYGSALHGSIFSPPGTVVCALRGTGLHPGFIQSGLGEVMGHPTGYIFGETEGEEYKFRYSIDEDTFRACLNLVFGRLALGPR